MSKQQFTRATIVGVGMATLAACSTAPIRTSEAMATPEEMANINSRIDPLCSDTSVRLDRQSVKNCNQQFNAARNDINYVVEGSQRHQAQKQSSTKEKFLSWMPSLGNDEDNVPAQQTLSGEDRTEQKIHFTEADIKDKEKIYCVPVIDGENGGFYIQSALDADSKSRTFSGLTLNHDNGFYTNDDVTFSIQTDYTGEEFCVAKSEGLVRAWHAKRDVPRDFTSEIIDVGTGLIKGGTDSVLRLFR